MSDSFFTYPLVLECTVGPSQVEIEAHHDLNAMAEWQVERMLFQFDSVLKQLCSVHQSPEKKLAEVEVFSPLDLQSVRQWNYNMPIIVEECIHHLFTQLAHRQPNAPAVCSWDLNLTYKELQEMAIRLAAALVDAGVGSEVLVPVVLDKSAFAIVAMLGIMLAGGAFIPLDPAHPVSRHLEIIQDVQAHVLVSPPKYCERYSGHIKKIITNDEASIKSFSKLPASGTLPSPQSTNTAYCIFTSGSTGKPKGVVIEHGAFCSSSYAYGQTMLVKPNSRVLQFASLTFDAGVMEVWTTLTFGGCVCIPSDEARSKDLEGAIMDMNVLWTY